MIIVAFGLVLAFVLVLIFSNRATRQCRWRARRSSGGEKIHEFKCTACGAETITRDGKPPRTCLRPGARPPM